MAEICLAAVFVGAELPLELQEFPVPDVGPENILVRMSMAAVCGTDAHNWYNPQAPNPIIWGHENIGEVAKLGASVKTDILGETLREGRPGPLPLGAMRALLQLSHGTALHEQHPLRQLPRGPGLGDDAARRVRAVPAPRPPTLPSSACPTTCRRSGR